MRSKIRVSVGPSNSELKAYEPYVYYIQTSFIDIYWPEGGMTSTKKVGWRGTGFLLEDGTFVTARHVTEAWYFWVQGGEVQETMRDLAGVVALGGKVVAHFVATSSSGDSFTFTSERFVCSRGADEMIPTLYGGEIPVIASLASGGGRDWAYMKTSKTKGLKFDADKSSKLERNTNLTILGFPFGYGVDEEFNEVSPLITHATVSANGLSSERTILTTNSGMEHGNSGGPVFYSTSSGQLVVVGIVSAIKGQSTGFLVPISNFKR